MRGPRGLANEALAKEYGLSEEQVKEIGELSSAQRTASRALGFGASEEERDTFDEQWKAKYSSVLTAEQKSRFEKELSQAPKPPGRSGRGKIRPGRRGYSAGGCAAGPHE